MPALTFAPKWRSPLSGVIAANVGDLAAGAYRPIGQRSAALGASHLAFRPALPAEVDAALDQREQLCGGQSADGVIMDHFAACSLQ